MKEEILFKNYLKKSYGVEFQVDFVENEDKHKVCFLEEIKSISNNNFLNEELKLIIKKYLDGILIRKNMQSRDFENIIEDMFIKDIFEVDTQIGENYNLAYEFLRNLEDLSQKTYEKTALELGIIILKNDIDEQYVIENFKRFGYDYIRTSKVIKFGDAFAEEKPLFKIINNKATAIILNNQFEVIGFLRKDKNSDDIETNIMNYFYERNEKILQINTRQYYIKLLTETHEGNLALFYKAVLYKEKLQNEIKQFQKEAYVKIFNSFIHTQTDRIKILPGQLSYIILKKNEIEFINKYNYSIILKNRNWKIKHYSILTAFLYEYLYINDNHLSFNITDENFTQEIELINRVSKLIRVIREMSERNIGGLFIILKTDTKLGYTAQNSIYTNYPELVKRDKSNLFYKYFIKDKISGKNMNIEDLDLSLIKNIAEIDGATILDRNLTLLSFGEIIKSNPKNKGVNFGARTAAAINASYSGLSIKISEDGDIEIYDDGKNIFRG